MDQIVAQSRAAIVKGSRSFRTASRLFDRTLREDVWQLYAWCRHCDDEIDGQDHGHGGTALSGIERQARLDRLRRLTARALAGEPVDEPAFAAFQRVALRHKLAAEWPLALLDGFALDVEAHDFEGLEDVLGYCWGVAGVVGVMMATIMGSRDQQVLRRAQDLGIAFQLTNICRDVAEDARNGRVYLPAAWLRQAGIAPTPEGVLGAIGDEALFGVVRELLALADQYYASARVGLRHLPFRAALAVAAAQGIYREIGLVLLDRGAGGLARRTVVSRPRKLLHIGRSLLLAVASRGQRRRMPARPALWSRI